MNNYNDNNNNNKKKKKKKKELMSQMCVHFSQIFADGICRGI